MIANDSQNDIYDNSQTEYMVNMGRNKLFAPITINMANFPGRFGGNLKVFIFTPNICKCINKAPKKWGILTLFC